MKWIELNNGSLVNLDALAGINKCVANIGLDSMECKIYYLTDTDYVAIEGFETPEQLECRMQQLKDLLLEKCCWRNNAPLEQIRKKFWNESSDVLSNDMIEIHEAYNIVCECIGYEEE